MIRGETINLRPFTRADLALFAAWANDLGFNSEYNTFGLRRPDHLEVRFAKNGLLDAGRGLLVVVTPDGEVVGKVGYHQRLHAPSEGSRAYNIGISLVAGQRGKGYGSEAQKLLAAYLFATYPIARVEATTDIDNLREQRALEKAGFSREGVLRKACWRAGDWHDMVMYSKLRGE